MEKHRGQFLVRMVHVSFAVGEKQFFRPEKDGDGYKYVLDHVEAVDLEEQRARHLRSLLRYIAES